MNVSDFLAPAAVMTDVAAADKRQLLQELAHKAASMMPVSSDRVLSELVKREELGSTAMGGGMAIPHARMQQVDKPLGLLVRLKRPIDFDAVDSKPVDIVFLLLLPETPGGEPLGALASISRKLRDPAIAAAVRGARDRAEIYRRLISD